MKVILVGVILVLIALGTNVVVSRASTVESTAQGETVVHTTIRYVAMQSVSKYLLCRIDLANGRSLYNVDGLDCLLEPGQRIKLVYTTHKPCLLCRTSYKLRSWDAE